MTEMRQATMKKSKKFNLVKQFYDGGQWGANRVHDAVGKGWITAEEYREITGDAYVQHGDD